MNIRRMVPDSAKRKVKELVRKGKYAVFRFAWPLFIASSSRMSTQQQREFAFQLASWRPAGQLGVIAMRWMMTELCPYSCNYCYQRHKLAEVDGKSNHAFRNYPVAVWMEAFTRHFSSHRLILTITGGEPMADRESIVSLVNGLSAMSTVEYIRIDTNAYWEPEQYSALDRSKLLLNGSFHPEQTNVEAYFDRMRRIVAAGFRVSKVNYVICGNHKDRYREYETRLRDLGIPIHPNADYNTVPDEAERAFFSGKLPSLDFKYRVVRSSPRGQRCLYPSVAYEMDYTGKIWVACFRPISGSFFDCNLPIQPKGPVPCPAKSCYCMDKYSLLKEANPERGAAIKMLEYYSNELLKLQDKSRKGLG